jgi:sugar transferase (PEP-CTERM system associated)
MLKILHRYIPVKTILLLITENLWITATLALLAQFFRQQGIIQDIPVDPGDPQPTALARGVILALKIAVITLICQISLFYNDVYDLTVVNTRRELTIRSLQGFGAAAVVLGILYAAFPGLIIRDQLVVAFVVLAVLILLGWRMLIGFATSLYESTRRVLVLGSGELANDLVAAIQERSDLNMKVIGFAGAEDDAAAAVPGKLLGSAEQLEEIVELHDIDRVVVALSDRRNRLPVRALLNLKFKGVVIEDAHTLYEKVTGKIRTTALPPSWLVFAEGFSQLERKVRRKQVSDFFLSLIAGALALPVAILTAIAIKLDSRGPVFYRQERVGYRGKVFKVLKFRTMRQDAEAMTGPQWASEDDPRITRVGRFLRKSRLDEIPQVWNIIVGDMSFVGPRPERPHFVQMLSEQLTYYAERHWVRPGLTGWAQIRYEYGSSVEDALQKLQYDLFYIKNMSLLLDLAILFETGKIVLFGRGR